MRVALIHYWLVSWRGGEQVLRAMADLYPDADIYTHVADQDLIRERFPGRRVYTTFISRLPFARRLYKNYLPLMPLALEGIDLRGYDLVISSESGPAKGVLVSPGTVHLCYCHSPMRYAWDMYHEYRSSVSRLKQLVMLPLLHYMRIWDQVSAQRVDAYVANSRFVASRIRKYYGRRSTVVHPPVAVDDFLVGAKSEDFYLHVGQLVPYKKPDLLVEAFNETGARLIVIGEGEMLRRLKARARPNIEFLGRQSFEVIRDHYARCRALIFPGLEDFGIVPVEAMAAGKPVIAFAGGGALETVVDGVTGVFFSDQSARGIAGAVAIFEARMGEFDSGRIREHAQAFSTQRFKAEFSAVVENLIARKGRSDRNA
jgi:glycosyltransferase involved in cell wall biosynthesis